MMHKRKILLQIKMKKKYYDFLKVIWCQVEHKKSFLKFFFANDEKKKARIML